MTTSMFKYTYRSEFQGTLSKFNFSQTRTEHSQFSVEGERTIITNHLEIRLIFLAVRVIVEQQLTTSYRQFQLRGAFFSKNRTKNDARQIPTIIIHPSLQIEHKRVKNSVRPGWMEPELNYIFYWLFYH